MLFALLDLQPVQAQKQHGEHGCHKRQEYQEAGIDQMVFSPGLPGFAEFIPHSSSPPSRGFLLRYMLSTHRRGIIRISESPMV